MTEGAQLTDSDKTAIRPFQVNVPEAELTELRRRINAARWPERETVTDDSQGVPLAMLQELARYWAADYDWRKCEAKLNTLPYFMTEIDGLDIHSFTSARTMTMRCRSSSRTGGPARSSSSSRSSARSPIPPLTARPPRTRSIW
jgi:Epoxide hydrolase N terminus